MTSDLFAAKFRRCGLLGRMVRGTERLAYRLVDGIITVNESYVERLCAQVPGKPVAVVLNVPDFAHWIDIGDRRLETDVDASTDGLVVGHHGTIVERFGSDIAVRAVGLLRARGVTVRLRILGDGDFASGLERLIHAEGLDESIAFDRRAFRPEEVEEFSRSIDVGVAPYRPSIFIDRALPVKVLEYVALGVPVIATSTEPLRRHVDEGAILYLREASPEAVAEAITLMLDHDRRRAYATAGRATARRLAWSLERDKLMLWIERLADRRNRH